MSARSIATHERELRNAQRQEDVEKAAYLERSLSAAHEQSFLAAKRTELPPPEEVDPAPIRSRLAQEADVPALCAQMGGGERRPIAPAPEPVDRYELMREHRRKARGSIPFFRVREQIEAAREADRAAELAAVDEAGRRQSAQASEQSRLDRLWEQLERAKADVDRRLPGEITQEESQRAATRAKEQEVFDAEWSRLTSNDPETTIATLERAFADNESTAAAVACDGSRTTVVMHFPAPEAIVPERKPARTPGGKPTLKKRTKTEINALYLDALGSHVLATIKETFATAPGTALVRMLVVRRETEGKRAGDLAPIYTAEFPRDSYATARPSQPGYALQGAPDAALELKGQTQRLAPIDLTGRPELGAALANVK